MVAEESNRFMDWNGCLKTEAEAEIEAYAKMIKEANEKKMLQIKNIPMYNPMLNKLPQNPVEIPKTKDWNSVKGQFGWTEINNMVVPYLIRLGKKYVSQQMAETKLFSPFRLIFTNEVCNCYGIKTFQATKTEATLLNEINVRHCDNYYGSENFVEGCPLNLLQDVIEMSDFLEFCRQRLILQNGSNTMRCGFVKIGNVNCVPYVCVNDKKYVPLFYFEGECNYLEERSLDLEGSDLAYLRIACKIQGIRKQLFDKDKVPVVELDLVKKFFLPGTAFVEFWQFENKVDHLIKETLDIIMAAPVNHKTVKQATAFRKKVPTKKNPAQTTSGEIYQKDCSPNVNSLPAIRSMIPNMGTQNQPTNTYQNPQNYSLNQSVPTCMNYNNYRTCTNTNGTSLPYYTSASSTATAKTYYPAVGCMTNTGTIQPSPNVMQPSSVQSYAKQQIPEILYQNDPNAYGLCKIQVENRFLNYCVNIDPYNTKSLLVTVEEVALGFFQTTLEPTLNAIIGMNLDIYLPNQQQMRILHKYNIVRTRGMIRVDSLRENLPQLKFILKSP